MIVSTMWKVQIKLSTLLKLQCILSTMPQHSKQNVPQYAKYVEQKIPHTMWKAERFKKTSTVNWLKGFGEETLIFSKMWKEICDIFLNEDGTI